MKNVLQIIEKSATDNVKNKNQRFIDATNRLEKLIFSYDKENILSLLLHMGTIPESFGKDSTEEKLFSKASDIALARALNFIGFDARVSQSRGDSSDVTAYSRIYGYSLVADAKAFRLSRTAKNAKDFKIGALNDWRKNESADYAVLVAPFFQYPLLKSQVYRQAMDANVCLFSWEVLFFLIKYGVEEGEKFNYSTIWNYSGGRSKKVSLDDSKNRFLEEFNDHILQFSNVAYVHWRESFKQFGQDLIRQGELGIDFWRNEIQKIKSLSRTEAIERLITALHYKTSISTIQGMLKKIEQSIKD